MICIWFWNATETEQNAAYKAKLDLEDCRDAVIVAFLTADWCMPVFPFEPTFSAMAAVPTESKRADIDTEIRITSGAQCAAGGGGEKGILVTVKVFPIW